MNHFNIHKAVELGISNLGEWIEKEKEFVYFMIYTGMNDRNKKEIYTGDICNDGSVVTQLGNRFVLMYKNGEYEDMIGVNDEVIGDIFQNPNLIK